MRFSVDVDVMPATRALDDDIGRAFDYDTIINGIKDHHRPRAISTWSRPWPRRWRAIASPIPARRAVKVKIEKLDKEPGAVGVEIVRAKGSV